MNGIGRGSCLEDTFNRLWELGHTWRPQKSHPKKPQVNYLALSLFIHQASGDHWNKYSIEMQWVTVIFLIHLEKGPGVESSAAKRGFRLNKSKYRENWAIEVTLTLARLCSSPLLSPAGMVWVWGGAMCGPPSPSVPSVYHGQCIRVENLLHVSMCIWFL